MRFLNSRFSMVLLHKNIYLYWLVYIFMYINGTNKYIDFPLKFQIFALCILISLWGIHGRSIRFQFVHFFGAYICSMYKNVEFNIYWAMPCMMTICRVVEQAYMGYVYGDRHSKMKIRVLKCFDDMELHCTVHVR